MAEVFHISIELCVKLKALKTKPRKYRKPRKFLKALNVLEALIALTTSKKTPAASTPKTSCKGWQSERRHEYSPANETAYKFCKGDIRPRGQWPKY